MSRSMVGRLVAKDLYLYRWMIVGALIGGWAALSIGGINRTAINVGLILFITSLAALGIFIAMYGILKEVQDKSLLFVLSLPVSTMQYTTAKISAALIAFLLPWISLLIGIVVLTVASDRTPDGGIPFTVALMFFLLSNFCILLALVIVSVSERWSVVGIVTTNISISLYFGVIGGLPGIREHMQAAAPVWTPAVLTVIAIEAGISALCIGLAFYFQSRKKDFV